MINIRNIQHYMYCPRRYGLMEINRDWDENLFVIKANIMHEAVHSGKHGYKSKGKTELSNIAVYNDELDLYGITDCIEFIPNKDGVFIDALNGNYNVNIIEYKPTQPKDGNIRETDAIQVFAQKLCTDSIWKCRGEGYIYYSDTKKRIKLPLNEEYEKYYSLLTDLINKINECTESGIIPPKIKGQKCGGCSMKDICIPTEKKYNVRREISGGI